MDPRSATITATEIVVNAIKAAQTYSDYQSKRNNATLTLLSLIAECNCVSVALHQIHEALLKHPTIASCLTAQDDASGKTFNSVLAACQVTFRVLHEQAAKYNDAATDRSHSFGLPSKRHKAKLVWHDNDIQSISRNVSGVVGGLNLLLQALSFKSTLEIQSQLAIRRSSVVAEQLADDAISLVSSHHSSGSWSLLEYRQSMAGSSRPSSSWSLMGLALADATLASSTGDIHYLSVVETEFISQVAEALKQDQEHAIIGCSETEVNAALHCSAGASPDGLSILLTHHNLKTIPSDWIEIVRNRLERLAVSHNNLKTLPMSLNSCHRLYYLNIRYNNFKEIPDCVFRIETLSTLDVQRNMIREISDKIVMLKNLRIFAIGGNRIKRLPHCMASMTLLHILDNTRGNPLQEPPESIVNELILPGLRNGKGELESNTMSIKEYLTAAGSVDPERRREVILCLRCGRALGYSCEGQCTVVLTTIPLWKLSHMESAECSSCVSTGVHRLIKVVGNRVICAPCVRNRGELACCGYCDKVEPPGLDLKLLSLD